MEKIAVDHNHFDRVTRIVGAESTRRAALRGLALGLLAATGLGTAVQESSARRKRRNNNRRSRCGRQYYGCNNDNDCCHGLICKDLQNPYSEAEFKGTCAYRRGCGKKNDFCGKNRDCCRNFRCRNKRCRRVNKD
jgi:hypothetical protein